MQMKVWMRYATVHNNTSQSNMFGVLMLVMVY